MATTNTFIKAEDGWVQIAGAGAFFRATAVPHSGTFQLFHGASTPPVNATNATGTVTLSSTGPADGNTVVIEGQTYTFKTTPSAATDVQISLVDNPTTAASFATKVNANSTVVTAVAVGSVVTLTSTSTGTASNAITLTRVGANIAVSGATLSGAVDIAVGVTVDACHGVKVNVTYTGNFYAKVNNSLPDRPLRIDVLTF
jgi:hypothetical protein